VPARRRFTRTRSIWNPKHRRWLARFARVGCWGFASGFASTCLDHATKGGHGDPPLHCPLPWVTRQMTKNRAQGSALDPRLSLRLSRATPRGYSKASVVCFALRFACLRSSYGQKTRSVEKGKRNSVEPVLRITTVIRTVNNGSRGSRSRKTGRSSSDTTRGGRRRSRRSYPHARPGRSRSSDLSDYS